MRFAASELGMRSGFIRPNPYGRRTLHDPSLYPLWEAAQELDFAIAIHGAADSGMQSLGEDRFRGFATRHCAVHTFEMMAAAMSFIMCGICDRFPRLRVGFLEAGGGWITGWLDRMDRHFRRRRLQRHQADDAPQRDFPSSMLHFLRADRNQPEAPGRTYRTGPHPVGYGLPASGRLHRRAGDDQEDGAPAGHLKGDYGGGRQETLRAALIPEL